MPEINDYGVTTPVHVPRLLELIDGYNDYTYISQGFKHGFKLGLKPNPHLRASNKASGRQHQSVLLEKLQAELDLGRIIGPFNKPPIPEMMISPMYCIPKPNSSKWRMIFNLSAPNGTSVNDNIPDFNRVVTYCDIKSVVTHILSLSSTDDIFFAKLDLSDAYRMVPMAKSEWKYLGMKVGKHFFVDCRLPMGAGSSCQVFQRISDMLKWLFASIQHDPCRIFNYLDDFLIVSHGEAQCNRILDRILDISHEVNVPIASHKTERATEAIVFLGIGICAKTSSLFIPPQKSREMLDHISEFLRKSAPSVKQWQVLLGKLCHLSQVVVAGRAYLSSVYGSLKGVLSSSHYVRRRITSEIREDLVVWKDFLSHASQGKKFKYLVGGTPQHVIVSDASGSIGYGVYMGSHWIDGLWPDAFWKSMNIAVLELFPIFLALNVWSNTIENSVVQISTDNKALVPVLNRLYCKDSALRKLVRPIALLCMNKNILLVASHIRGSDNVGADLLSRGQREKFLQQFPDMSRVPTQVPELLSPDSVRTAYW